MAFHVACPITCRRICFCSLGFTRNLHSTNSKNGFLQELIKAEGFLKDPWGVTVFREGTVQVSVPKVSPVHTGDGGGGGGADTVGESAQAKRLALQRKAAAAMVAAEDYARKVESGDVTVALKSSAVDDQGQSNINVMCRMCLLGENEGSEKARRMLSCCNCGKRYHRSCLKSWAKHRDLFHWSSWTCPQCRTCEVCRSTGDPTRLMFCKRCDGAYHCYCQHPSHKNVSSGPYLCPKHTRCHSCGSNVPGNGLSVRWFLGYTCCDACGRLFVKGNYCPICLKVYRDSESTPMVCCDVCQRWVHCHCDGISDEKYLQFQVDGNLQYKCATCRGECYQVTDLEDAVRELWKRRDMSDRDLIASLRAAAGLPTQEEIFSLSPYSDDEENGPTMPKNEFGRTLKFSLKGLADKSPKKNKEHGKKSSSKKHPKKKSYQASLISKGESQLSFEGNRDIRSQGCSLGEDRNNEVASQRNEGQDISSPVVGICSTNQPWFLKHKLVDEVMISDEDRTSRVIKIKSNKPHNLVLGDDNGKYSSKSKTVKAKKLVINLCAQKINVTNSPMSDVSSFPRDQNVTSYNGVQDANKHIIGDKFLDQHDGDGVDGTTKSRSVKIMGREGNMIKFGKIRSEIPEPRSKAGATNNSDGYGIAPLEHARIPSGKGSINGNRLSVVPSGDVSALRGGQAVSGNRLEDIDDMHGESSEDYGRTPTFNSVPKDSKPSLKFKLKKPVLNNLNSQAHYDEEKSSSIKGQRSKRKRPSPFMEKSFFNEDNDANVTQSHQDSLMDGIMDASWILKKLGKDAVGKKVEIHQASDNSWHKGVVTGSVEGSSILSVRLDDGRVKPLELGKQGVRFVLQRQKRLKI